MEKRQRMTLLGIAAAIAVAAVVIALVVGGGSDDDGDSDTSNTGTQAAQTETAGDTTQTTEDKPKPEAQGHRASEVEGGEPVGGVEKIKAKKGDTVQHRRDERRGRRAPPARLRHREGARARQDRRGCSFKANVEGVFEVELARVGAARSPRSRSSRVIPSLRTRDLPEGGRPDLRDDGARGGRAGAGRLVRHARAVLAEAQARGGLVAADRQGRLRAAPSPRSGRSSTSSAARSACSSCSS